MTTAATIIYCDPIDGTAWGWFPGSRRPLHIQPISFGAEARRTVVLERDGRRTFEPDIAFRRAAMERLRDFVERRRLEMERRWVASLALEGRLVLDTEPGFVLVTMYPGEMIERTRPVILPGGGLPIVRVEGAVLVVEQPDDHRAIRIDLADVFFGERACLSRWSVSSSSI